MKAKYIQVQTQLICSRFGCQTATAHQDESLRDSAPHISEFNTEELKVLRISWWASWTLSIHELSLGLPTNTHFALWEKKIKKIATQMLSVMM